MPSPRYLGSVTTSGRSYVSITKTQTMVEGTAVALLLKALFVFGLLQCSLHPFFVQGWWELPEGRVRCYVWKPWAGKIWCNNYAVTPSLKILEFATNLLQWCLDIFKSSGFYDGLFFHRFFKKHHHHLSNH